MKNSIFYLIPGSKQFKNGNKPLALIYFLATAFGYISGFFPGLFIHAFYLFFSYRKSFSLIIEVDQKSQSIQQLEEKLKRTEETFLHAQNALESITSRLSISEELEGLILEKEKQETELKNIAYEKQEQLRTLDLVDSISELENRINELNKTRQVIKDEIGDLRAEVKALEEEQVLQSYGFYEAKYSFPDSEGYQAQLDVIKASQKKILISKKAAIFYQSWVVEGSEAKGKKMMDDYSKLMLRAFNGECDAAVSKVRYNNITTMEKRIQRSFDALNKLGKVNKCEISSEYYDLKLRELQLTHEYREKKQEEQEEQRFLKEQMREEQRVLKELEKARKEAEKEEEQYQIALEKARKEFVGVSQEEQEKLQAEINELEQKLKEAEQRAERAKSRAQMTKSGYVYVISNIGSFGENVYKIGMTRREDPDVRIRELSGASVPFPFDIHAQIWSENAPGLESKLHQFFSDRRLNKANERKEFFHLSLDEIEAAVTQFLKDDPESKISLHFTKVAEAAEYRKTLQLSQ
jgi:Domain of unknown function (DUF4041)/T5orf172 domain